MSEMMIVALQAQVADLQLARKQANEVVGKLMQRNLPEMHRQALFEMIALHMREQDVSRSAQLAAVLQTVLMTLNAMAQTTVDPQAKEQLVETIKSLNIVLESK